MSKMKELDAQIRCIVREEMAREELSQKKHLREIVRDELMLASIPNPYRETTTGVHGFFRTKTPVNEGNHWTDFESDILVDKFVDFCEELAKQFGRSSKSISCKTRRLMHEGMIPTWPKLYKED